MTTVTLAMRALFFSLLIFLFSFPVVQAQDACKAIERLTAERGKNFSGMMGGEASTDGQIHRYRSSISLPGFDQNYFEQEGNAAPVFTAKMIGFESLEAAGKALDSLLQKWSACLRGYTFYKEENCRLGCNYYVGPNNSREAIFYASYLVEPGQPWYGVTLQLPAQPIQLPTGLSLLAETHPPLIIPAGNLDACQTLHLYLKAGENRFQDLLAPDGSLKVNYPESMSSEILSTGAVRIVLASQTGDEGTALDEAYLITQSMLNDCLKGWSQLELMREDDADFLNDRQWLKGNQSVALKYEITNGGKGKNRLVLLVSVR